jgi:RND family efflux transporter MFP subunit
MRGNDRLRLGAALAAGVTIGCGGGDSRAEQPGEPVAVQISPSNIVVIDSAHIESGPAISGSLQAAEEATLRAEVSGAVLQTYAEEGETVTRGELVVRIEDTAARESMLSARSAVGTAEQSATLARRNAERTQRLFEAGAVSERDLEAAQVAASTAESQLADARARLALAQKQLSNTQVRAPFHGVVSERVVNAGDVVQPGTALITIVDPSSMRLEGAVPASNLTAIDVGAPVEFTVNGYPSRLFAGRISRINPTADPATGQVTLLATIPNAGGDLVAGLFAEGRVGTVAKEALVAPMTAVDMSARTPTVLRVRNGVVERVAVEIGLRDEQTERVELASGVAAGDTLLVGAAQGFTPGTPVRIQPIETAPAGSR